MALEDKNVYNSVIHKRRELEITKMFINNRMEISIINRINEYTVI